MKSFVLQKAEHPDGYMLFVWDSCLHIFTKVAFGSAAIRYDDKSVVLRNDEITLYYLSEQGEVIQNPPQIKNWLLHFNDGYYLYVSGSIIFLGENMRPSRFTIFNVEPKRFFYKKDDEEIVLSFLSKGGLQQKSCCAFKEDGNFLFTLRKDGNYDIYYDSDLYNPDHDYVLYEYGKNCEERFFSPCLVSSEKMTFFWDDKKSSWRKQPYENIIACFSNALLILQNYKVAAWYEPRELNRIATLYRIEGNKRIEQATGHLPPFSIAKCYFKLGDVVYPFSEAKSFARAELYFDKAVVQKKSFWACLFEGGR